MVPVPATVGHLIVNADDWGRDVDTTERTLECIQRGAVSSVSAMVFMEDSERAAASAAKHGVDAGLHLNFTSSFSAPACPARLRECQRKVAAYLQRNPLTRGIFNPLLAGSFEYLVAAQREEFHRLYGSEPSRYDGHHHMHLSANVLLARLLPEGTLVRQHFSHEPGEKAWRNQIFRTVTGSLLRRRRYRMVDFLFSLPPLDRDRLSRIFALAHEFVVELETHPIHPDEYEFLTGGEIFRWAKNCPVASRYVA